MATGDSPDIQRRLRSLIPGGWFGSISPIRDAIVATVADALVGSYALLIAVKNASRRATSTGWLLDLDAWGFFRAAFIRRPQESDDSFRARYKAELFRPRSTKAAIIQALTDLTGRVPLVFEQWNPADCGAYDSGTLSYAGNTATPVIVAGYDSPFAGYDMGLGLQYDLPAQPSGQAFGGTGFWASTDLPYQLFVTAFRPLTGGIPNASGFDVGQGGYDAGLGLQYVDMSQIQAKVSDAEIYACVARCQAAGVTAWTAIQS